MGENWPSKTSSSLSHHSTSAESKRTFIQSSRKSQRLSDERLLAAEFKERDLDHLDHRRSQLHASKIHHIREGFFETDHETDSRSHGFSHAVSLTEVSLGEADALLTFKDGIGNYSEGALDDWTPGKKSEYCSWTRVTCNRKLHVTALNLSSLDLTGSLGPSLCNLPYLEELHLDKNFLQSEIPPELGRLSRLRILNLEENLLHGGIPKELGNLTSLQVLNLGSQGWSFNGTIPEELGQLSELRFLNLGVVYGVLRGIIPKSLGNCTKLWYLDFYGNGYLTGVIPQELGKLKNLEYLSFDSSNLTGGVPDQLGNLTRCKYLSFRNSGLQGHLPVGLVNLSRLVFLDVASNFFTGNLIHVSSTSWSELLSLEAGGNLFSGTFPELLLSCRNLVTLYLDNNNFSGNLPADLGRLSSAKSIYIARNMLGGELPKSLSNISLLTSLDLSDNNLTGPLNALKNSTLLEYLRLGSLLWIKNSFTGHLTDEMVRSWPKMEDLDLSYNSLIGKLPRALGNLTQLYYLVLAGNKFHGGIPEEFGDLQKLILLYLNDNELTEKIPARLANLQDVTYFDLGNNNLTGSIPQQLGNLTHISILSLHTNNLIGEIPSEFGKFQTLSKLYLFNNNLTGSIPVTLNNCSFLWTIRLSSNSLTGHLTHLNLSIYLDVLSLRGNQFSGLFPTTSWNCSYLQLLDLSKNYFSGVLPNFDVLNLQVDGVNSRLLRVLSLASNNFSGSIPSSIWKLPALQVLDLSSNAFTGELPHDLSGLLTYKLPVEGKIDAFPQKLEIHTHYTNLNDLIFFETISLRKGQNALDYTYLLRTLVLFDVSGNHLSGELPKELGTLFGLTNLYMAGNNFEGSIPTHLGEISNLLELDLSRNQLSGPIPMSLSRLRLSYLNLSLNQLSGPIPIADSFDTRFSESFLPGNPKLCGDSINKPCDSSVFVCSGDFDPGPVTERLDSWSLYFHGASMTAFTIGASIGFTTVIGLITLIPAFRNRFLFPQDGKMDHVQPDYYLFHRPS
ncbi:hypothetical protein MARPO_1649s0001 [Marchantia polymorpha]|uniref:Uncharacterized protein n=1 Tax=Marchantia polymorpha TaxID=3197 RepID=A0A2R6VXX9_MARPO|nr:hypothetical protein MARPO_1649s0001 [Marchantia polymorpha]|eukprot:PTQ26443.1 hypothetical protein MARPO_1649s0001 [Marchantia polymorpha]